MARRGIELTEDQWARIKAHAATRRQTISAFLSDVVDSILGDGTVRPATRDPGIAGIAGIVVDSHMEGDTRVIDKVDVKSVSVTGNPGSQSGSFGHSSPAPKPGKVKRP